MSANYPPETTSEFSAQRLARVASLARSAWWTATLLCVALALGALSYLFTDAATQSLIGLALMTAMIGLTLLVTRIYVQQLVRLYLQAAVIERQNLELRATSEQLKKEIDERVQVESQRDSFFNLSADLLAILDGEGRFVRLNPAFAATLGESDDKVRAVELVSFIHPAEVDEFRRALERLDESSGARALEARAQTREGYRWFLWTLIARGRYTYAVAHDFTAHRQAADALREAKEAAELANETKTQFLANMSHELRTPLNAIIGFSQTLDMGLYGQLTAKQQEYVRDINRAGEHLLGIVADLLDLSVIDSGAMVMSEQPVVVSAVVDAALALVKTRAEEAGVNLVSEVPEHLPKVKADVGRIRQILVNLLGNAIKFTPEGGRVTVRAGRDERDGGIFMEVVDTGIGIKPTDIPQVLAPFGRLKSAYAKAHGGVGLGLPLSARLANLHGGDIAISSQPGLGTTVRLWLPPERIIESEQEIIHGRSVHQP
jgi:PAS domain S-box-containing protein